METFEPPKYLASLIVAINDGAKAAQAGAFAFALVGLYLLATAFSATDEDLLLDRTLAITQLSAQIPVTVSFAMMPILFVALHVFTLIRYDMLAANVRHFIVALRTMVPLAADREHCRQLLANVEFIQSLTAPPGSPLRSALFGFVAWVVIAGFPVTVLLAVQTNALRYQSEVVTVVQRISLLADLAVLFWFYRRQARGKVISRAGVIITTLARWGVWLGLPALVVLINLAWLNVLGSAEDVTIERYTKIFDQPLDDYLCPKFNWGCRFLRVDHRTLIGKVWDSKAIIELGAGQTLTDVRRASFEGVFLYARSLRFANLSESRLYAADMDSIDLRFANLAYSKLIGARLSRADLRGAQLFKAHLSGAILGGANLTRATLGGADLTGANMVGANLTEAVLIEADLTGAYLLGTNLTRANLKLANLTETKLTGTNMTGADLAEAKLTGAYLWGANLDGTKLTRADLTRADLSDTDLSRADLTHATLTGVCGNHTTKLPLGVTIIIPCPLKKSGPPPPAP